MTCTLIPLYVEFRFMLGCFASVTGMEIKFSESRMNGAGDILGVAGFISLLFARADKSQHLGLVIRQVLVSEL